MTRFRCLWLDAFASEPFRGNPAAVVLVPHGCGPSVHVRHALAAELGLSETAFVEALEPTDGDEDPFRVFNVCI